MHGRARGSAPARAPTGRCACATATISRTVRHAHGYVVQTLADLGWVGLGLSLLAAVRLARGRGPGRRAAPTRSRPALGRGARRRWRRSPSSRSSSASTRRSTGPGSCPATSCRRCCARAGWHRARRCASASTGERTGGDGAAGHRAARSDGCPRRRDRPRRRLGALQPVRSLQRAGRGLRSPGARRVAAGRRRSPRSPTTATRWRSTRCSTSRRSSRRGATCARRERALDQAIELEPANPETWRRLGALRLERARTTRRARCSAFQHRLLPRTRSPRAATSDVVSPRARVINGGVARATSIGRASA